MEMRSRSFQVTTGNALRCRGWRQEGLLRMLENVLAVGEDPQNLVVYAALGRAARDWPAHDKIVETLKSMREGETLLVQSGKPIGLLQTHRHAPLVIMANCNLVGQWAKAEVFYELAAKNLICWGGLTAGDWQYIGSQGVIQGTYEIFARGVIPDIVTDQTSAHDLVYGYVPAGFTLEQVRAMRSAEPQRLMQESLRSIAVHVRAMLDFQQAGAVVFDNGNLIRTHARQAGVERAFDIPIFSEAFLRPLFARGIGPFRWVALGGDPADIARIDHLVL